MSSPPPQPSPLQGGNEPNAQSRLRFSAASRPAFQACLPVMALGLLATGAARVETFIAPAPEAFTGYLSAQQTLIVQPRKRGLQTVLRGEVQPAIAVTGQAPMGGQVSRVWVK